MNNMEQCDPHVLESIIDKYRKRNKALEERESVIIKILANIDREKSNTSEIECKIRSAISDSKNFDREVRPGRWSTHDKSRDLGAHNSDYYPRLSGKSDRYMPIPSAEYERLPSCKRLDLDGKHMSSWSKFPKRDAHSSTEREQKYSRSKDGHGSSMDTFGHSYSDAFMSDTEKECVRAASPEGRGRSRQHSGGARNLRKRQQAMRSDPDVERLLQMTDPNVPCDANDNEPARLTVTVDSMLNVNTASTRTFTDEKRSRHEQKEDLSEYMKDFISPSIQEMIHSYEQRHTDPMGNDDYKRRADCDTRPSRDKAFEDSRPMTRQNSPLFAATPSKSRGIVKTSSGSSSPMYSTTLGRPFSDSDRDTSNESIPNSMGQRTKTDLNSNHLTACNCSKKMSISQHSSLSERESLFSQQSSVHDDLDLQELDFEYEQYEFEENYSNNYLNFLIRKCMPTSLLRSEYNSSYNWSTENKQDIFNKIEEIELIKKVICEELDYREFINTPFKLHRSDRRTLLRNIIYAESVKRGLSKGLPICGVMALFAETGSTGNIKELTLQTIRQANELLDENHPDPRGVDNIVSAAEDCVHKLMVLDKTTGTLNSSKLCKILLDVISREPTLDPRDNLLKCIDELKRLQVDEDTKLLDEVDSLRSEVCRLRNIIWSVEEHAALKARREVAHGGTPKNKGASYRHGPVSPITRDDLTKEQARLMRQVGRMKRLLHELEHEAIPRAISKKKEEERLLARKNTSTNESLQSCDSYNNTCAGKSREQVHHDQQYEKYTSEIGIDLFESAVSSIATQSSTNDVAEKEQDSLKNEVDRLKCIVEHMERRFVHGNESGDVVKSSVNDLEMASERRPKSVCTVNLAHVGASTKTCSSTQTTHSCILHTNNNSGHVNKRVVYVVANKGEDPSDVVKQCTSSRINSQVVIQMDKMPNAVSSHTVTQKTKPTVVVALSSNIEKESDQNMHEQIITVKKSDDSVYTTREKEQTATPCAKVIHCASRNLPVIPETSDVFVSALSIPCATQASDLNDKSKCSTESDRTDDTDEGNKAITKRRNTTESMWENMVNALIPGIVSKRQQHAGDSSDRMVAPSDSNEGDSSSHLTCDDQCSNKQAEDTFFKIIHKSGSAYEISSTALNEDTQTHHSASSEKCKQDLADDFSKQLALAVKICKGPEAAAESFKEAFRESYVATCEKAINDALKDIIKCYPSGNNSFNGKATQISKSKKMSKKRSAIKVDDTTLSDCSGQYTRDDIVIVGTTKMNNGRNAANDPSFRTVLPNLSKKKQRALAAMKREECLNVSYEPSNTTLIDSDYRRETQLSSTMIEQECSSVIRDGSRSVATPKDQESISMGKGISSNRIESRSSPKTKITRPQFTFTGRRIGNKGEPSNGINAPKKKNFIAGNIKTTKNARPFKRTSKEGNRMALGDKAANNSDSSRKNVKSGSFREEHGEETSINNGIPSRKAPSEPHEVNSEVAVLFDGADRMEEKESNENAADFDAEETAGIGDRTNNNAPQIDCRAALKTVSRFEIGQDYKNAMMHVKNCPSCTKKLLPTLLQVVNKVEDMSRKCESPDTSKTNNLKSIEEQETERPRVIALSGKSH